MKKEIKATILESNVLKGDTLHLVLDAHLDNPEPGQFVELGIDRCNVLLNRPISIYNYDDGKLELLVKKAGRATGALFEYKVGEQLRVIGPLGKGFSLSEGKALLVGGGVGIAPLLYLARILNSGGRRPVVVYGERSVPAPEIVGRFEEVADVYICTDDGSAGFHGFVSANPVVLEGKFDIIQVCGPKPMMKAMAGVAADRQIPCEVSLENMMACGLGACLCCVEPTGAGNICVCKEGPVFNIDKLTW